MRFTDRLFGAQGRRALIWVTFFLTGGLSFSFATQVYYLSPDGDDAWSGKYANPLTDRSDGPLATVAGARERVRVRTADTSLEAEPVLVIFRAGTYRLTSTLHLNARDSGVGAAEVVWQAYPGERALLSGGTTLSGFRQLAQTDIAFPVAPGVREQLYVASLKELGIAFPREIDRRVRYDVGISGPLQLYFNNALMTLARYPNDKWLKIADVPQESGEPLHPGHHSDQRDGRVPTGRHFGSIGYKGDRPSSWAQRDDIWLHGYWTWDWADSTQRVENIATERRKIKIAGPHHRYGYTTGQRFYFFNVPEELDSPGEWYLDRESGYLFFWPPGNDIGGNVVLATTHGTLVRIDKAQNLTFRNLEFAHARGAAFHITDSESVEIDGCRFFSLGGRPVTIEGGSSCGVRNSTFTELSTGAVYLDGGDRMTLQPGRHFVENNHIHDFAKVYRTNHPAIRLWGVGQRAAHNLIHNSPHMGLTFMGNDHMIEFNEIHDIAKETGDVGAIYTGRDYTSRGTVIRYNYLHDLHGPGLHGVRAVYLDDFTSGIDVFGNIFYQAGRAAFIGGGRNNRIVNNLFIECAPSVQIDGRALSWANHHFDVDHPNYASTLRDRFAEVNAGEPPYALRYPPLVDLYSDEPKVPKYNTVENNLSFDGIFLDLYDGVDLEIATVRNNLIADPVVMRMTDSSDQEPDFTVFELNDPATKHRLDENGLWGKPERPYRVEEGSLEIDWDTLPEGVGFLPIPLERIGLQEIRHLKFNPQGPCEGRNGKVSISPDCQKAGGLRQAPPLSTGIFIVK